MHDGWSKLMGGRELKQDLPVLVLRYQSYHQPTSPVDIPGQLVFPSEFLYRSASSSSGRGICAASCISFWYCCSSASSTWTVGGASAGAATNS